MRGGPVRVADRPSAFDVECRSGRAVGPARVRRGARRPREDPVMLRDEWRRLFSFEERHRRLLARLLLALILSAAVFVVGTILVWQTESGRGDIGGLGDAAFFTGTQLLSVSSSMTNPLTAAGRGVDIFLEAWS